jgi:hypothetical protein
MTKSLLLIMLTLSLFGQFSLAQEAINDERLREIISKRGQAEVTVKYTDTKTLENLTRNVSIISVKDNIVHIILSPLTAEWFILQKFDYKIIEQAETKGIVSVPVARLLADWDTYPSYTQYDSIMQSFSLQYPKLCQLDTIGTSVNGKLVLVIKITGNEGNDESKPAVFYSSTIHGNETGGFILMLHLADYLLKNYKLNSRVTDLMDNLQIWINPLANPDGTYNNGNVISDPVRFNANGYDLNRNFPDPITPNTVKQKETVDMVKFMRKHRFVLSANFHSGSEVVNYPWDRWLTKLHADDLWFNDISRAYADTVHYYAGPAYMNDLDNGVTRGAVWYIVYGGRQDFITWELQGREVTIELDNQFITPPPQLPLLWQNNYHSLLGYLENAINGIHGIVLDSRSSAPVPAKIFIAGHDKDSSQVYADTLKGTFVRFLSPGSWNIIFSANGYRDTIINNIIVYSGQRTDITVKLTQLTNNIDTTVQPVTDIYPNPAVSEVRANLPDIFTGPVNVQLFDQAGRMLKNYNTEFSKGTPLIIDIGFLSAGTYTVVFTNKSSQAKVRGRIVVIK